RAAHRLALRATCSRFASSVPLNTLMPVALPPGRLSPSTSSNLTGSPPTVKTMGIVRVAAFAARGGGKLPLDGERDRPLVLAADRFDCRPSGIRFRRSCARYSRLHSGPGGMHKSNTRRGLSGAFLAY